MIGKISREDRIVIKALRVATCEWEKLEFTPLYERICERKVVQIAPRSTYKKSVDAGLPTENFIVRGRMCDFL